VGWRALAFALGDLAAKGATPTYGLVSLSMPPEWSLEIVEGVYRGLSALASEVGLKLVGGDTSRAGEASLTLALLGRADVRPLPRSAVRAGWWVAVTGPLGGASLLVRRPRPLLARGVELAAAGCCSGDISDGLLRELDKFAMAAGVGGRLELPLVPCAEGVRPEVALASGEEVELVSCGQGPLPTGLIRVGGLTGDQRVIVVDGGGEEVRIEARGYDHFA
jgi:thiamine-monophosphate kinase